MDGSTGVLAAMRSSLALYWRRAHSYQRFLYGVAGLFAVSAAAHAVVVVADNRPWGGPVSWRKPLLFSLSFALVLASLAWAMTFLPRRPVAGWTISATLAVANVGEVLLIAMQAWRKTASHFNTETPFDEAVFLAMGILIGFVVVGIVAITVWAFLSLRASPSFRWAILAGLILLVAGQAIGGMILAEGSRQEELGPVGSPVVFGQAGVVNVPHGVSLHALQFLPAVAWLLSFSGWEERRRMRIVQLASVGYAALVATSLIQGLAGRAAFGLDGVVAVLFWASVALLVGSLAAAVAGLRTAAPAT